MKAGKSGFGCHKPGQRMSGRVVTRLQNFGPAASGLVHFVRSPCKCYVEVHGSFGGDGDIPNSEVGGRDTV